VPTTAVTQEVVATEEQRSEPGCNPSLDGDGDGIDDCTDTCPTVAEDLDGDRDADGCPERSIADAPTLGGEQPPTSAGGESS
jgi:hypothetical protein